MAENVCCPSCWSWSEAGSRTTCRKCGTPLVTAEGRQLGPLPTDPPPPPPPPAEFASPAAANGPPGAPDGWIARGPARDWVAICRWFTIGYGALGAVALLAFGLLLQHVSVPVTDPNTGLSSVETFNIGAAFAFAALLVAAFTALFAWLTRYTVARVIFLLLDALALLSVFSGAAASARGGGYVLPELVSVVFDLAYGAALVMSLVPRGQPAYV